MTELTQSKRTHKDVQIAKEETLYQGFFHIKQYQLKFRKFAGDWSQLITRELFDRGPVAAILPYDPAVDQVVLLEQFRIGALREKQSPWLIELVAGILEPGEDPKVMAHRETQEETGLQVQDLIHIFDYWTSPGGTSEYLSLFCAKVDAGQAGGIHGLAEEQEDIRVFPLDRKKAYDAVQSGKINNAATIIALQWLQLNHTLLQKRWTKN